MRSEDHPSGRVVTARPPAEQRGRETRKGAGAGRSALHTQEPEPGRTRLRRSHHGETAATSVTPPRAHPLHTVQRRDVEKCHAGVVADSTGGDDEPRQVTGPGGATAVTSAVRAASERTQVPASRAPPHTQGLRLAGGRLSRERPTGPRSWTLTPTSPQRHAREKCHAPSSPRSEPAGSQIRTPSVGRREWIGCELASVVTSGQSPPGSVSLTLNARVRATPQRPGTSALLHSSGRALTSESVHVSATSSAAPQQRRPTTAGPPSEAGSPPSGSGLRSARQRPPLGVPAACEPLNCTAVQERQDLPDTRLYVANRRANRRARRRRGIFDGRAMGRADTSRAWGQGAPACLTPDRSESSGSQASP